MSAVGGYAVVIADFHRPVTLVSEPAIDPIFAPAQNALGPGMWASALTLGSSLWVYPPSSPEEAAAAVALGKRAMAGIDSVTTDFALLDLDTAAREGHQRTLSQTLWPVFSMPEKEAAESAAIPSDTDWSAYRSVNDAFARYVSMHAAPGARVMVRDLELLLLPGLLRELRPDVSISFFSFAPWATESALQSLPAWVAQAISVSLAAADDVGFLSQGSVLRFRDAMRTLLPDAIPDASWYPLPIDSAEIAEKAFSRATDEIVDRIERNRTGLRVIARAERAERPVNLLGGLESFRRLLTLYPQWKGRVVHLNAIFPGSLDTSWQDMLHAAAKIAAEINAQFGTATWRPIEFAADVDYLRSLAVMRLADVYVANPTLESISITTWEALELNERSAAFILSDATGVAELFPQEALVVDPYDIDATAHAMHEGLLMPEQNRRDMLDRMRQGVRKWSPAEWFAAQLHGGHQSTL